MRVGRRGIFAAAVILALAGCSDTSEPTAQEIAEAELARKAEAVAQFPSAAKGSLLPALDALTVQGVSDMDGAVEAVQTFQRASASLRSVSEANLAPDAAALRDQLKASLKRKQVQLFPTMRRTYAHFIEQETVAQPLTIRAAGSGAKTLRVTSPMFGSSETVDEVHHTLMMRATQFRFTRAEYVWSLNGNYKYYVVHGDRDDDIGT